MDKPKVVAVVGTNASGKSALGVRLAKTFRSEEHTSELQSPV